MRKIYLSIFLILLLLTGCSNSKVSNESKDLMDKKLLVYVSGPEEMLKKLEAEFERERGDVTDFLIMSCGQVKSKVWTESEAGDIQADVILGADPLIYAKLDQKGLLENINIKESEMIKEGYIVSDKYVMVNERYVAIMYNNELLGEIEIPKGYRELINEEYKDALVMADANQSATAFGITSAIYQIIGDDINYYKDLQDNGMLLIKSNGQVPSKIMEGNFMMGIGPHDAYVRLKKKAKKEEFDMPVELIWPEEGIIAIQRPMGLIKDDSRSEFVTETGKELINFFLSEKAQNITKGFGFASVRKDIENDFIPKNRKVINIDWEKVAEDEGTIKENYQSIFKKN